MGLAMHVPSYLYVLKRLGYDRGQLNEDSPVAIPLGLLKMLLQIATAAEAFDEDLYVRTFPDVAEAVAKGIFSSPASHFLSVGYFEGRQNPCAKFDEDFYVGKYTEAFDEISEKGLSNAFDHFIVVGREKGYAPNAKAFEEMGIWFEMLK